MTSLPHLTLDGDVRMPALGFGVFQSSPEQTADAVGTALRTGYRHIDTAAIYGNEREVGEGLRRSGVDREEVFLESKVWLSDYGTEATLHAFEKSAAKLGVSRIDLLILHQPLPSRFDLTLEAYRALESLRAAGKVRAIGVSNFRLEDLERLLPEVSATPAVNQVELHPYFQQRDLQAFHAEHGILTQAWSPIGGITFYPGYGEDRTSTLEDPVLARIAAAHGRTATQVMLAWHLAQGRSAIPKSVTPSRIAENFDVLDIALSAEEITAIDALDTGRRVGPEPADHTLEDHGVEIPEA
ncbi:MAG: aldo/keto reductase [Dermabacteraceae bacterium]